MIEPSDAKPLGDRLAWFGLIVVALLSIARAMIEHDPFPWWTSDPFVFSPPIVGLTPRWALLLHIGILLASIVFLIGQQLRGIRLAMWDGVLLTVAFIVLGFHLLTDIERVLAGSGIGGVACVLLVASRAHTLPGAVRVLGSVTLGFALMLAAVGVHEVFVSHPQTMLMFERGKGSFLAARGWSDGSFEAMAYERRLRNPEPIAWFGLTNVFASFMAASAAAVLTLALILWNDRRVLATLLILGTLVLTAMLVLSGSKGGYAVLAIGVGLGMTAVVQPRLRLDGRVVLALCGLVILGLVARGVAGESLGERSLLFRWQYLVGGLRVWLEDPLLGSGPGMFQQRYALLKPALSPEDVASPHSIMLYWLATLGVGGFALIAVLLRAVVRLNPRPIGGKHDPHADSVPAEQSLEKEIKASLMLVVLPTLLALHMQRGVLSMQEMLPVLIGGVLWGGLSVAIIRWGSSDRALRPALFVAAGVLMVHAMLEVTGSLIVSAPLWALMIGLGCGGRSVPGHGKHAGGYLAMLAVLGMGGVLISRWPAINAWERALHGAADEARAIAQVHTALNGLEFSTDPEGDARAIAALLGGIAGRPVEATLDSIISTLTEVEADARARSTDRLRVALDKRPSHTPTRIALSQQLLWLASVARGEGRLERSIERWDRATTLFEGIETDASGHRWAGNIWSGRVSAVPESGSHRAWLERAQWHWERALGLAPHDPRTALRLMDVALDLGDEAVAREWALRAIRLHEQARLDPLRGLSESQLALARSVAAR